MDFQTSDFLKRLLKLEKRFKGQEDGNNNNKNELRPYKVYVPENMNGLKNVLNRQGISFSEWKQEIPAVIRVFSPEEFVTFVSQIVSMMEDDGFSVPAEDRLDLANMNGFIDANNPLVEGILKTIYEQPVMRKVVFLHNNHVFGFEYQFYLMLKQQLEMPAIYEFNEMKLVELSAEYFYRRTKDIEIKFWPKDEIKIYCIPNVSYSHLTDKHVRPASMVVDVFNRSKWERFGCVKQSNGVSYNHAELMTVNKSIFGLIPELCPCKAVRDDEGNVRIYFLNVDPVVLKGFLDFYCIGVEYGSNSEIVTTGILTNVISANAIIRPSDLPEFDWNTEKNEKYLIQYILLADLLGGKQFVSMIKNNVLNKLSPNQLKKIRHYVKEGTTNERLEALGL